MLERLHIYLTNKCNLHCSHCWVEASPTNSSHLTADQIIPIIKKAKTLKEIKITGGEPLLYQQDLFKIFHHSKHLKTTLETNATLINKHNIKQLNELDKISISIDGPEHQHNKFRNTNTYKQTLNSLKQIKNLEIISCIHPGNIHQIDQIINTPHKLKINFPSRYGRAKNIPLLTLKQIIQTTHYIEKKNKQIEIDIPRVFRLYPNPKPRCNPFNLISILPDGRYSLCGIGVTNKQLTFGNINQDINKVFPNLKITPKGICAKCKQFNLCHCHCLAYSISEYNSLNGPFPLCQEAYEKGLFPKNELN